MLEVSLIIIFGLGMIAMMIALARSISHRIEQKKYIDDLESYLIGMRGKYVSSLRRLREIDLRGAFEADDEVGYVYKQISAIVNELEEITPDVNLEDGETKKEE